MKKGLRPPARKISSLYNETQTDLMKKGLRHMKRGIFRTLLSETQTDLMKKGLRPSG